VQHVVNVKKFVQPYVSHEMERPVKKCVEPEHAPEANQPGHAGNAPNRCDAQRDEKKSKGPLSRGSGDHVDRVSAKVVMKTLPHEHKGWSETNKKRQGLEHAHEFF